MFLVVCVLILASKFFRYFERKLFNTQLFLFFAKHKIFIYSLVFFSEAQFCRFEFRFERADFIFNSNMTWFFSPIKSTDTNSALFPDISALAHWQ